MKTRKLRTGIVLAFVVSALALGVGPTAAGERSQKDIVVTAIDAGNFKTLVAALQAAGLVKTLKGAGPFTVFAPTDSAFAKLPPGTVESLLKPENKAQLVAILTYHVVPGSLLANQVTGMTSATTVNGEALEVQFLSGRPTVGGAGLVQTDILCTNGVIHAVDTVLMPK